MSRKEPRTGRVLNTFNDMTSMNGNNGNVRGLQSAQIQKLPQLRESGYGAKILKATAFMLEKSAVWPSKLIGSLITTI